ncbi:delta-60 repeat domain-containing protein [Actinoplanes sp. NEAU-A12]|uniref:Delta-60 repeat domain-containing protein n=1 Tax=Actinoplanes sandaracinus TaxID=3045177 RepID=A0ABT6WIB7_9ACTN|nr:delta-60 repeat domain-containing protein [Actinoplanes sandaracinus]MDI6099479.1 delta-60 repeat domain-containing protein [Actinoplanes sandaracinus]
MILAGPSPRRRFPQRCLATLLTGALVLTGTPADAGRVPLISAEPDQTVGFDGLVYASTHVGDTVYLGGNFTHAIVDGKEVARKRLAAVDARTGRLLPWAPLLDDTVLALTASGGNLYVTGEFTTVAGQPRAGLAAINLTTAAVSPLKHTIKGVGQAITVADGRLYVGGSFTAVNGRTARNLAAFRLSDGAVDTGFQGGTDGKIQALTATGPRLYVGGAFRKLNGTDASARLGALRLADGKLDTGFRPQAPYPVFGLTIAADKIYAAVAGAGGRVAAYQPDGKLVWSSVTDGDVQAITYLNGAVYAGGHFTVACPQPSRDAKAWCPTKKMRPQPKMAAWDPNNGALLGWNPRSNGKWGVLTMKANPKLRTVTVGGDFTAFGTASRPRFAQFRASGYGA